MNTTCFVISPFGEPFDDYYKKIYKPAIEKAGLKAIRADEIYGTGVIIEEIFAQIVSSRMIICEVTGKNPNVNYELGVASVPLALPVPFLKYFDGRHFPGSIDHW